VLLRSILYTSGSVFSSLLSANSAAADQNGQVSLSNLVILAGQFNLTNDRMCKLDVQFAVVCYNIIISARLQLLFHFDILTLSCKPDPACQKLDTLDVCQTCSVANCNYCTWFKYMFWMFSAIQWMQELVRRDAQFFITSAGCTACDGRQLLCCDSGKYLHECYVCEQLSYRIFCQQRNNTCEHCVTNCRLARVLQGWWLCLLNRVPNDEWNLPAEDMWCVADPEDDNGSLWCLSE